MNSWIVSIKQWSFLKWKTWAFYWLYWRTYKTKIERSDPKMREKRENSYLHDQLLEKEQRILFSIRLQLKLLHWKSLKSLLKISYSWLWNLLRWPWRRPRGHWLRWWSFIWGRGVRWVFGDRCQWLTLKKH